MILFRELTFRTTQEAKCSATFVVAGEAACGGVAILSPRFPPLALGRLTMQVRSLSKDAPDCHRKTLRANICVVRREIVRREQISKLHIFISFHPPLSEL